VPRTAHEIIVWDCDGDKRQKRVPAKGIIAPKVRASPAMGRREQPLDVAVVLSFLGKAERLEVLEFTASRVVEFGRNAAG
jgi:hypothetical protein